MIYSMFNDQLGAYEVYEDSSTHALNGDFPVPELGPDAGDIGVPASEAGRSLPSGAKRVGTSWHARGLVVAPQSGSRGLGEITKAELGNYVMPALVVAAVAVVAYVWGREERKGTFEGR